MIIASAILLILASAALPIPAGVSAVSSELSPVPEYSGRWMVQSDDKVRAYDDGVGIAKDMLDSVFDLFVQSARTLDRSAGGLGRKTLPRQSSSCRHRCRRHLDERSPTNVSHVPPPRKEHADACSFPICSTARFVPAIGWQGCSTRCGAPHLLLGRLTIRPSGLGLGKFTIRSPGLAVVNFLMGLFTAPLRA